MDGHLTPLATQDANAVRRRRHDRGSTLTEVLIAITLTGILVASVVAAVHTAVTSSSRTFTAAEVETVLINAGDRVQRAPQRCEYESYVDAAATAEGWDASAASVTVEQLVANNGTPSDWAPQACPDDVGPFDVQRMTITVTDPSGSISRSLRVVKSDVE